jgi:hypothetical protein
MSDNKNINLSEASGDFHIKKQVSDKDALIKAIKEANETHDKIKEQLIKEGKLVHLTIEEALEKGEELRKKGIFFEVIKNPNELSVEEEMRRKTMEEIERVKKGEKIIRTEKKYKEKEIFTQDNLYGEEETNTQPMKGKFISMNENNNQEKDDEILELESKLNELKSQIEEKKVKKNIELIKANVGNDISKLSEPQWDAPADRLPLPSKGKCYHNKQEKLDVAYLTGEDEIVLSSPNLLESGDFLSVLFNRKILNKSIRYEDLLIGDRDAIMLWLRTSSYGHMYPITFKDPYNNDEPFETEIDLSKFKIKKLDLESDENGNFSFKLPVTNALIKFKFLTIKDLLHINNLVENDKKNEVTVNNIPLYTKRQIIVSINGNSDSDYIDSFVRKIPLKDNRALTQYYNENEPGVDLAIKIKTPGGGLIDTYFQFDINFFWV